MPWHACACGRDQITVCKFSPFTMRVAGIEHRLSSMAENTLYTLSHFSTFLLLLFKIYVCECFAYMHACAPHVCSTHRGPERVSDSLRELQTVIRSLEVALGIKPGSLA